MTSNGAERTVELPLSAYSVEAVKRAAYALMAQYDVTIEPGDDRIRCVVRPATRDVDMAVAERNLRREALDQDLRISIEARTQGYRDAVLGLAFSRTGLQDG